MRDLRQFPVSGRNWKIMDLSIFASVFDPPPPPPLTHAQRHPHATNAVVCSFFLHIKFCPRGYDFTAASLFPCGGLGEIDLLTGEGCVVSSDNKVRRCFPQSSMKFRKPIDESVSLLLPPSPV